MAQVIRNVRNLAGAIMSGLGRVSYRISSAYSNDTEQLRYLSRRYPDAPVSEIVAMHEWALDAVARGEILSAGLSISPAALPDGVPIAKPQVGYYVKVSIKAKAGQPDIDDYYTPVIGSSELTLSQISQRVTQKAMDSSGRKKGKSPPPVPFAAWESFQVTILSVWME